MNPSTLIKFRATSAARLSLYLAVQAVRNNDEATALAQLNKARLQTSLARAFIAQQEKRYRYGSDILTERRDSLTTYPYGYLHETSTGYFWTRRDDQLAQFINTYFHPPPESWGTHKATHTLPHRMD